MTDQSQNNTAAGAQFASTHWSVVLTAAQTNAPGASEAMARLCSAYWYPLYAWLRRQGRAPHEAEDLTQEFFAAQIVTRKIFNGVQPGQGKFRSWLLGALQHLLCNEWDKQRAQKRGSGASHLSLDLHDAEGRYLVEPASGVSADKLYERAWALGVLEQTHGRLRERYVREGKAEWFDALKDFLPGAAGTRTQAEVAAQLGKAEGAVWTAVHRLRQEFGRALREEIRRTVSTADEVDEEIRQLMAALA